MIDLEIVGRDEKDGLAWFLWSEHKVKAAFGDGQLPRYADALKAKAGSLPHRLIAITLDWPTATIESQAAEHGVQLLRWSDVLDAAERAGIALAGTSWRSYPADGDAEPKRRLLLDWLIFSENEGLNDSMPTAVTAKMVDVLSDAEKALDAVDELAGAAFDAACEALAAGRPKGRREEWSARAAAHRALAPDGSWIAEMGAYLYVGYDTDGTWAGAVGGRPAFKAGMYTEGEAAEALHDDRTLQQHLALKQAIPVVPGWFMGRARLDEAATWFWGR